ncbi:MAG TPA: BON domain-containing protein, partial [Pyrinomonadaceae bacterium]|nr:BON domain-containing protein [Pyrinomonadaceae bacterium]
VDRGPAQYFSDRNPDVRIIVENGRMTLEGVVSSRSDSNTLNILAHGINGVFEVTNNMVVGKRAY